MMYKIGLAFMTLTLFVSIGGVQAQTTNAEAYCDVCEQKYHPDVGMYGHVFDMLGGVFDNGNCLEGPHPDGSCHRNWYSQLCSYAHTSCEWQEELEVLSSALKMGEVELVNELISSSPRVTQRQDGTGFDIRSCDGRYRAVVLMTGETKILLEKKVLAAEA